ncbi:hypothetical protein [Yoonia sp. SS1-5]|uniref:Uncharacterized protein n=1 Tax=Yoonia rhodophyticola TaxID=3137370 RepID=A0AAN0MIF3_9RHOB
MFKIIFSATIFSAALVTAQTASAYAVTTVESVTTNQASDMRVAEACLPRLSPQMAATFGLPVMHPSMQGCSGN